MIKRIRIPSTLTFPVRIAECHLAEGAFVEKGDRIYTIEDSAGRKGFIRAPISGHLAEGLVPVGAAFDRPVPIAGLNPAPAAASEPAAQTTPVAEPLPAAPAAPIVESAPAPGPENTYAPTSGAKPETAHKEPSTPRLEDDQLLEKDFKAFLIAHDTHTKTQSLETYREGFGTGLKALGHAPHLVAAKIKDRRLEERWNEANATRGGFILKLLGLLIVLLALAGLFWVLVELRLAENDGMKVLILPAIMIAIAAGVLVLMFLPDRLIHGGVIILWAVVGGVMAPFLLQAEPATLAKWRDYAGLSQAIGSLGIPGFSRREIPIAEELDLPEISNFSNGRVPRPTADQQAAFERLILQ